MNDEKVIMISFLGVAFFFGMLFIFSGFSDVNTALEPDLIIPNPGEFLSLFGTGSLKTIIGLILVIAVIAPKSLQVIFSR